MTINSMGMKFDDDDLETHTAIEQRKVEQLVEQCYRYYNRQNLEKMEYSLDCSGPWLVCWTVHSLEILRENIPDDLVDKIISFLQACQATTGGFGGGPDQMAHLASSYAAVMTLCILKTKQAYDAIDRPGLCRFLKTCFQVDGSFLVHEGGEADIRGSYCALAVARLVNLPLDVIFGKNFASVSSDWLTKCQTYEGGFGACPGCEAHGGYTFCGLAAIILLHQEQDGVGAHFRPAFNVDKMLWACFTVPLQFCHHMHLDSFSVQKWVSYRHLAFEGGFQGRTNKLVDACYSYWQGAIFPLINLLFSKQGFDHAAKYCTFETQSLENYLLICCQKHNGGLVDKPGKNRDLYHTCYSLSGLAIAQKMSNKSLLTMDINEDNSGGSDLSSIDIFNFADVDPLYNIGSQAVRAALNYFRENPIEIRAADLD